MHTCDIVNINSEKGVIVSYQFQLINAYYASLNAVVQDE